MSQVPSPPDDGEAGSAKRAKGSGGAIVGRWQETPSRSGSAKELRTAGAMQPQAGSAAEKGAAAPGSAASVHKQGRKLRETGAVDVLQFLKYFHLVPAQVQCPVWTPILSHCSALPPIRYDAVGLHKTRNVYLAFGISTACVYRTARHTSLHCDALCGSVWCVTC